MNSEINGEIINVNDPRGDNDLQFSNGIRSDASGRTAVCGNDTPTIVRPSLMHFKSKPSRPAFKTFFNDRLPNELINLARCVFGIICVLLISIASITAN